MEIKKLNKNYEVIITGATGFVGKVLMRKVIRNYNSSKILCLVYDKTSPLEISGRNNLDKLGVDYFYCDLTKKNTLLKFPKNPKLIIHMAAQTNTAIKDHSVNDLGTKNLYASFEKLEASTHFVHIGTMVSVVGRPNCSDPINEDSEDYPTNEYTRTKVEGEEYIASVAKKDKFRLTIIRPNTIYGKGFRSGSLFDMVGDMVNKNSIITRINWPGMSALIHVDDVVGVILKLSKIPPLPGKPVKYLAYSENLSISEISRVIHKKKKMKYDEIKIPNFVWQNIRGMRRIIPSFENILPYPVYNSIWRFGIIIDDVVWCKSDKLASKLKTFKPSKFKDRVTDVLL